MPEMKYAVKDSVFTFLFKLPEYLRQLYLVLHPEDKEVKEDDCKIITIENILTVNIYNDLGFQVRDKLILLVEAQSTFSLNIVLRLLLYLATTYQEYEDLHNMDLYYTKPINIPRPELYVIYTGDKDVPETVRLSDLYNGCGDAELTVHILKYEGTHSIIDQYIRFCKIADEQRKKHGYTVKAVEETIRICIEQNILAPFLLSRQKEVHDIMTTLFDQEKITRIHEYNIAQENLEKGMEKGMEQGMEKGKLQSLCNLMDSMKWTMQQAMDALQIPNSERNKYEELLEQGNR